MSIIVIDPYRFGERDPLWEHVRLLVGCNEATGSIPQDFGPYSIVPTDAGSAISFPRTGSDPNSFTGQALVWSAGHGYLRFEKSGGFFVSAGGDYTMEVWADLSDVNTPGSYSNFRNCFAVAYDEVAPGNVAIMSAAGFGPTDMTFGYLSATGFRFSMNVGAAAAQGYTRLTRNHCVVQHNASAGRTLYFVNGYFFGHQVFGTHSRNPNVVYLGNVQVGSAYTVGGSAEWLRLTESMRYPETALDDGLFPSLGDKCFEPPTGPFPTN